MCAGMFLTGNELVWFYWNTNGFLKFVLGFLGRICPGLGGHFGGLIAAGPGRGALGTGTGKTGFPEGIGQNEEQEPNHVRDAGVPLGGDPAGLAIQLGAYGYGDASCFLHGLAFLFVACLGRLYGLVLAWTCL